MRNTLERTVVVGVDPGGSSMAAVDFAAAEAVLRGLPLLLLSAHPTSGTGGPRTTLTATLRRVCATWPELAVAARNVTGEAAEALIAASRSATALVVGRDGSDPAPARRPVGAQVVAHSLCPTLVVPADTPALTQGPVLLGLGMSPEDEPALAFAFEEAALRRVPLLAAHVWSGIPDSALGTISPFAYDLYEAHAAADRILAETVAGWGDKYPDVKVDRMPLYDVNPARTLLEASTLAGLVVVGTRRHAGRSSQLLGTVTRTLIAHAPRPVAVIRPTHRT